MQQLIHTENFVDYPRMGLQWSYSRAQMYMVYYVDRHRTKRLWLYLIVFLMWKPQWKKISVASWIHNMTKSSSYACVAVTETTFTRNWHYIAPSCIYFSVSDVSLCRYSTSTTLQLRTMGPCIHSFCINYGRSLMLLATHPHTHIALSLSLSDLSLFFILTHTHIPPHH